MLLLVAILIGVAASPSAYAQTSAEWSGTWIVNLAKSSYDPAAPPFKRQICRFDAQDDGATVVYDIVGTRGGVTHLEWTGKFDGRDYPIEGADYVLTNAYTRIDDRTYDVAIKVDGRVAATARMTLSADGRTITTVMGPTKTVFDRQ
jgi:hypothetical protein